MKKKFTILGLTLVAVIMSVMCVFTACNQIDSSTYVEPSAKTLAEMIKTIELEHKTDVKNSTPSSYKVAEKAIYGEELAYIKWTAKVETEGANENDVTVSAPADNFIMIVINDKSRIEFTYTLTATLTNKKGVEYKKEDGSLYTVTFTHTVPAYTIVNWQGFKENCEWNVDNTDDQKAITVKGYIIGIVSTTSGSKGSIYLQDEEGYGYYAYAPTGIPGSIKDDAALRAAWPVGTEIEVTGEGTVYNGQYEFQKGCAVKKTGNKVESLPYRNATEAWGSASNNTDKALIPYQNSLVTLEGCKFTRIKHDGDKVYYYFTVNGVEYNIYKTNYFMDDADVTAMLENYQVGKQATIKGLVSYYSAYQIYPVGSDCISKVEDATFSAAEKVDAEAKILDGEVVKEYTANATTALKQVGSTFNDVAISWSFKEDVPHTSATIDTDKNLVITLGENTEEFVLVATISCGAEQVVREYKVKTIVIKSNSFIVQALTAARALADKASSTEEYIVVGTVCDAETYNEQFKNVTFYLTDGENKIMIYRYNLNDAASIKDGDVIALKGKLKKYGNDLELVSKFTKIDLTSIAAAKKAGEDGTGVAGTIIYGQIKKIDTAYSEKFKNISVTLTDGTNDILCHQLSGGSDLQLGDYILVTGTPGVYKNVGQIAKGATYTKEAKVSLTDADKVTAEKAALSFTKDTTNVPLTGKTYTDVAIAWTSSLTDVILINADGTVTINNVTEKTNVTITATLTLGEVTQTVVFTVILGDDSQQDNNSLENPYTAGEALAEAKKLASGVTADKRVYVTGVVSTFELRNDGNGAYKMNIKDENGIEFLIFQCKYTDTVKSVKIGDTVVVSGFLCNFGGTTYELTYKDAEDCKFESVTEKVFTNTEKVAAEKDALEFSAATSKAALAGATHSDVTISWSSDNVAIAIADDGTVTISEVSADTTVTITATLTCGDVTDTKTFNIDLKAGAVEVLKVATITFDNTSKRTSFSAEEQVWTENGITVTNKKASSTSDIADYSNPARFYKSTSLKIAVEGKTIKKIVFNTNSKHLTYTAAAGETVTNSGKTGTTIEFANAVSEFSISGLSSQIRVSSIEITYVD